MILRKIRTHSDIYFVDNEKNRFEPYVYCNKATQALLKKFLALLTVNMTLHNLSVISIRNL